MKFVDLFALQHKVIAMGMVPAPSIANLFVAIYKEAHITSFPSTFLPFLKRFIDDGFGIWLQDPDPDQDKKHWDAFQSLINRMGLTWEFSQRSNEAYKIDLVSKGSALLFWCALPETFFDKLPINQQQLSKME